MFAAEIAQAGVEFSLAGFALGSLSFLPGPLCGTVVSGVTPAGGAGEGRSRVGCHVGAAVVQKHSCGLIDPLSQGRRSQ